MTLTAVPATDVRIGASTSLRTLGGNFRTRFGWETTAPVRGRPIPIAYKDGGWMQSGGTLDAKILTLDMIVWGRDRATGNVTSNERRHLDENIAWLKGLLGAGDTLDFRFYRENGDIHQAYEARVLDSWSADPDPRGAPILRARIPLWVPEGTLRDISGGTGGETDATNVNLTGSGSTSAIVVGGNVRTSPVLTFTADNTVTDVSFTFPDGSTLAWEGTVATGTDLVFDCAERVVTNDGVYADAGLVSAGRRAYWGRLEAAASNTLGYTIGSGQGDLTVQWYDRWR